MYRPYPNADRALRQIARHHVPEPPSELTLKLAAQANAALAAAHESLRPFRAVIERLRAQPYRPHALYDPASGRFELVDG